MPTYEYECTSCGHEFELFQKMSDPPCEECPECESKVKKKIGAGAGLIFKGTGFYITDYRSDAYKKQAKAESGQSSAKEKGSGSGGSKSSGPDSSGSGSGKSSRSGGTKSAD